MKTKIDEQILDAMSKDPRNWKGPFYFNPRDPRLLVPKLYPSFGKTLNIASPYAYITSGVILIIVLLLQLWALDCFAISAPNLERRIDVTVNKNFELLYAMHISSNADSLVLEKKFAGFPLTTQQDFELRREYDKKFRKFRCSDQVKLYDNLTANGFTMGASFNALLRVDTSLTIIDSCYFEQLPIPQKSKEAVYTFFEKLKEFKEISDFDAFYGKNKTLYDSIIKINEQRVSLENIVFSIENFFNKSLNGYHLILVPLMWPGGVSIEYNRGCTSDQTEIYVCIGTKSVSSGIPNFGTDDEYKSVLLHEFAHPFVKKYCEKYRSEVDLYAELYKRNENVFRNNGCHDWFSAINELLTRTVEIIINSEGDTEKARLAVEFQSKELGFSYIPVLYQAFQKHYKQKGLNKANLDQVFPEIIHSLKSPL